MNYFKPQSPNPSIGKHSGDNAMANIAQLNEIVTVINAINANIESDTVVKTVKLYVTSAQILALNTTALKLVSASSVNGEVILPLSATLAYTFGTNKYIAHTGLAILHSGASIPILKSDISQSSSAFAMFGSGIATNPIAGNNILANADLNLWVTGGDPEDGDGTMVVTVSYIIVNYLA
jgi:hypothetical protein